MEAKLSHQETLAEEISTRNSTIISSANSGCYIDQCNLQLRQIIRFARNSVPFYQQFWSQIDSRLLDSPTLATLPVFPLVNRKHISQQLLDICADDIKYRQIFRHRTSGTTGLPVTALVDEREWHSNLAFIACQINSLGIPVLDPTFGPWCYMQINSYPKRKSVEIATPLPNQPIWRRLNVPAVSSDNAKQDALEGYQAVLKETPTIINGMPTVLRYVGQLLRRLYGDDFLKPQLVIASGEQLDEAARYSIEQLFDRPVYNLYASGEAGCVAMECKHRSLHLDTKRLVVETTGASKSGPLDLVATTLTNFAMPLIRYKTGDYGEIETTDCPCGDPRPRLSTLVGHVSSKYLELLADSFNEPLWQA